MCVSFPACIHECMHAYGPQPGAQPFKQQCAAFRVNMSGCEVVKHLKDHFKHLKDHLQNTFFISLQEMTVISHIKST